MRPNEITTLFEYGYWAFDRVWDSIQSLTDAQFAQELDYSRGSIRNQAVHMMSATQRWIIRINGGEMTARLANDDFPTKALTKAKWDELRVEAMKYLSTLSEADLDANIKWQLPERKMSAETRCWEILLHVANHATDHRAQILAMLNQHFHIETPEQDMIFFLREAR